MAPPLGLASPATPLDVLWCRTNYLPHPLHKKPKTLHSGGRGKTRHLFDSWKSYVKTRVIEKKEDKAPGFGYYDTKTPPDFVESRKGDANYVETKEKDQKDNGSIGQTDVHNKGQGSDRSPVGDEENNETVVKIQGLPENVRKILEEKKKSVLTPPDFVESRKLGDNDNENNDMGGGVIQRNTKEKTNRGESHPSLNMGNFDNSFCLTKDQDYVINSEQDRAINSEQDQDRTVNSKGGLNGTEGSVGRGQGDRGLKGVDDSDGNSKVDAESSKVGSSDKVTRRERTGFRNGAGEDSSGTEKGAGRKGRGRPKSVDEYTIGGRDKSRWLKRQKEEEEEEESGLSSAGADIEQVKRGYGKGQQKSQVGLGEGGQVGEGFEEGRAFVGEAGEGYRLSDEDIDFSLDAAAIEGALIDYHEVLQPDPFIAENIIDQKGRLNPPVDLRNWPDLWMGDGRRVAGVDVARYGDDKTVICVRYGIHVVDIQSYAKQDVVETTARVVGAIKEWDLEEVVIDVTGGLGGGVVDLLRKNGIDELVQITEISFNAEPRDLSLNVPNRRSEMYVLFMKRLQEGGVSLPGDEELLEELVHIRYEYTMGGDGDKLRILPKDKTKEDLGRSPDRADSCVLAFYGSPGLVIY